MLELACTALESPWCVSLVEIDGWEFLNQETRAHSAPPGGLLLDINQRNPEEPHVGLMGTVTRAVAFAGISSPNVGFVDQFGAENSTHEWL